MTTASELLATYLQRSIDDSQWQWLTERRTRLTSDSSHKDIHITLGFIPRKLGREDLKLSDSDRLEADQCRTGWKPQLWSVDAAARALIIHDLVAMRRNDFADFFKDLCRTADLNEQISLYQATALLEPSDSLEQAISDGLRTSIQAVFEAIAHNNPYPKGAFNEHRWNHMVLKALFIDSTLHPIVGLDERSNPTLAAILCDYAHERWAANRVVTPELWRCVGPHATTDSQVADLHRALKDPEPGCTEAALLALSQCPHPKALSDELKTAHADTLAAIQSKELTWASHYQRFI